MNVNINFWLESYLVGRGTEHLAFPMPPLHILLWADQESTNKKMVKQLTLPNIKPLQVKIIPLGTT